MTQNSLPKKEINLYAFMGSAQTLGQLVPATYVTLFMTDFLTIDPTIVGTALLIVKTIDFLVSLVAGAIIEKSNMKWGKYASWLKIISWVMVAGGLIQLTDTSSIIASQYLRAGIVMVGYCMLHCSMSFLVTSRAGVMQKMAGPSMSDRRAMTTRQVQFGAATTILSSAITLPLIHFLQPYVGESAGYFIVCLMFGTFYLVVVSFFMKIAMRYDVPNKDKSNKKIVTVRDMVSSLFGNKQMLALVCVYSFSAIGTSLYSGLLTYYFRYVAGAFLQMALCTTIRSIVAFGASLVIPAIGKKLGKRRSLIIGKSCYGLTLIGVFAFARYSIWIMTFFMCLGSACMYLYSSFGVNYYLDCGEYGYYKTGKDTRAVAMGIMNIPTKIGFAVGGSLVGYGLGWIGFTKGMEVTPTFVDGFMRLFGLVPAAFMMIAALIALFCYKITDEDAANYAKANAEKDAAELAK